MKVPIAASLIALVATPGFAQETIRSEQRVDWNTGAGVNDSATPVVTSVEDVVVAAWSEDQVAAATASSIFASVSDTLPAGGFFRRPTRVSTSLHQNEVEPRITMFEDKVFIAWLRETAPGRFDVYGRLGHYCVVRHELQFDAPVVSLGGLLNGDSGSARNLHVAMCGDEPDTTILVAWEDDVSDPGGNHDVYAVASQDCGASFSAPERINAAVAAGTVDVHNLVLAIPIPEDEHEEESLSVEPECCATAYLAWLDDRGAGGDHVYLSRTQDSGVTWSSLGQVDGAAVSDDVDELAVGALECDVEGLVFLAWTDNRNLTGEAGAYRPRFRVGRMSGDVLMPEQTDFPDVTPIDEDATRLGLATSHLEEVWLSWLQLADGTEADAFLVGGLYDLNSDGLVAFRPAAPAGLPYDDFPVNATGALPEDDPKSDLLLQLSEGAVQVVYLAESETLGNHQVWMSFLDLEDVMPQHQILHVSVNLASGSSASPASANLGDHSPWESHIIWSDDRNGLRDVFVSGLDRDHPLRLDVRFDLYRQPFAFRPDCN